MLSPSVRSRPDLRGRLRHVLVIEPYGAFAELSFDMLRCLGAGMIDLETSSTSALDKLNRFSPDLIVTEYGGPQVDGATFTRSLRRSELAARRAPVIMISAGPTPQTIAASRDAGAHEFLRKPFSVKEMWARVENAILRPRVWIEAVNYVGPDRRRFNSSDYVGTRKRKGDHCPDLSNVQARVTLAVKILKAAAVYKGHDRAQVARSVSAQFADLETIAAQIDDARFALAVRALRAHIGSVLHTGATPLLDGAASPFETVFQLASSPSAKALRLEQGAA